LIATRLSICILLLCGCLSACAPKVGSEEWCEDMVEKPKGDWTVNEAKAFAEHCVFKNYEDQ